MARGERRRWLFRALSAAAAVAVLAVVVTLVRGATKPARHPTPAPVPVPKSARVWAPTAASGVSGRGPGAAFNPSSYDVLVQPGQLTQALLNSHPAGTTFALAAGEYRLTGYLDVPSGDQLLGFAGAVISGGKDISSGWTSDGAGHWFIGGQTPIADWSYSSPDGVDVCGSNPNCHLAADVWLDHSALNVVTSVGAVGAGSFYFDKSAGRIYIGVNPAGHLVETNGDVLTTSGRSGVIQGTNVTFRNLVVEEMGTNQWGGAMLIQGTSVIDHSKVWLNHMDGISGYGSTAVTNSIISNNGETGIANAVHTVTNDEIAYNNSYGFSGGWDAAGLKFANTGTSNTTLSQNWVHNNYANGIWYDTVGTNNVIENNVIENNDQAGVSLEVGPESIVRNNIFRGNGASIRAAASTWWAYGVGLLISDSSGTQAYGNYSYNNANGPIVVLITYGRTNSDGAAAGANNSIHDNYLGLINSPHALLNADYMSDPSNSMTGALCTLGGSPCVPLSSTSWTNNHYYVQSGTAATGNWFVWNGGVQSFATWQAAGRDAGSTIQAGTPTPTA
jgi:parallel beta-helix repeat protein